MFHVKRPLRTGGSATFHVEHPTPPSPGRAPGSGVSCRARPGPARCFTWNIERLPVPGSASMAASRPQPGRRGLCSVQPGRSSSDSIPGQKLPSLAAGLFPGPHSTPPAPSSALGHKEEQSHRPHPSTVGEAGRGGAVAGHPGSAALSQPQPLRRRHRPHRHRPPLGLAPRRASRAPAVVLRRGDAKAFLLSSPR
jgi:hypothetical protein